MHLRTLPLLVGIALAIAPGGPALADDSLSAKEHYKSGVREYDLAHYAEAAREFEAAYKAKPDPAFLYNLGQAYRLSGEKDKAVSAYRSFLRRSPSTRNRREVEDFITQLQKLSEDEKKAREPGNTLRPTVVPVPASEDPSTAGKAPATTGPAATTVASTGKPAEPATVAESAPPATQAPAPPTESGGRPGFAKKVAGGVLLGVGVATAAAGIAFAALASGLKSDLDNPPPGTVYDAGKLDSLQTDRTLAVALCAAGGAVAVTGAIVLILGVRESRRPPVTIAPTFGPTHAGAVARFEF